VSINVSFHSVGLQVFAVLHQSACVAVNSQLVIMLLTIATVLVCATVSR